MKPPTQSGHASNPPDRAAVEQEAEELLERILFVLSRRVRASSMTIKEIDQAMGVASGYTSHLLQGDLHLQASHIAALAQALEVPQREIYAEVFPEVARVPNMVSEVDPPPAWWPREDVLRSVVAEILDDLTEPMNMDEENAAGETGSDTTTASPEGASRR